MKKLQKNAGLKNFQFFVLPMLIILPLILTGCDGGGGGGGSASSNQVSLELGESTTIGSAVVGANGLLMIVDTPDDPVDGLEIDVPQGAFQEETGFTVSHSPIISHSGNKNLDPVTPLITIETGGEYSDKIMTVKIPVTIEDGYHYMAFYYDEATGKLEGIPELTHDETSLTIATRHFSKILINRLMYNVFFGNDTVDSGFKVKQDNWQFENPVTHLSPGICSGMSIASLYYYNEKKKKQAYPPLFAFYDNGTSVFDIDDDQAIKLCSTIQWWDDNNGIRPSSTDDDLWTYFTFIHAILLSGEPQYVSIYPSGNDPIGHAMVVYKKSGNDLYVSDPNLPEDQNVKIEFEWSSDPLTTDPKQLTGSFKPFESQWNKGSDKVDFTEISYSGTSAFIDYSFDDLWNQLDNGTVPWNKSIDTTLHEDYPEYEFKIIEKDASGTERESDLTDNYETTNSVIKIKVATFDLDDPRITAFYAESPSIRNIEDNIVEIALNPGENNIGLLIDSNEYFADVKETLWAWTDFKYFKIKYEKEDTPEPPDLPEPAEEYSIIVKNTYDKKVNLYIETCGTNNCWSIFSRSLEPGETESKALEPGEYNIKIFISNETSVKWLRQVNLTDQDFFYDFAATQDCTKARITITNQTQYNIGYKFEGFDSPTWSQSTKPGEKKDYYFEVGKNYSLWARGYIGCPDGVNFGDACYSCWSEPAFTLDCQGYEWTVSGSGSTCP